MGELSFKTHCALAFILRVTLVFYSNFHDEIFHVPYTDVDYMVMVTYNPVLTSQYFFWYLSLLPLCLPRFGLSLRRSLCLCLVWILSQSLWLLAAYLLEFQGLNTFTYIWIASLFFFVVNVKILNDIIAYYKY
ncbi:GPI mannosyltransferase 1 [Melipona quadrifasciata]|uniref:GPI alpha-1,4-mannosyltransferase I, catalytic subunit n=1 Tax=Melipona quadrifasciata TaxID=166423 RepID=A0A0M8ZYE0_9HYME|nr:GPI mannosyltransferase 1 [Melipona quadrifasciata]